MSALKKKQILLVEDDAFIRKAYKAGLEASGFEVVIACDGNEALQKTREKHPCLILLDIVMAEKTGFELLEEMKMDKDLKKIPVVILSNLGQESDIKQGKELGAVDYLVKSNFSMKQVIDKVKFYIAKYN